jgi:hypothetical protein
MIGEEHPEDGTEVGGGMFEMKEVWKRRDEIVPDKKKLSAIVWEENLNTSLGEVLEEVRGKNFVSKIKKTKLK